jgi:hypothetical protein
MSPVEGVRPMRRVVGRQAFRRPLLLRWMMKDCGHAGYRSVLELEERGGDEYAA